MKIRLFAWSGLAGLGTLIAVAYFGGDLSDIIALGAGVVLILTAALLLCLKRTRELPFNFIFLIIGLLLCAFFARQQFVRKPVAALAGKTYIITGWVASETENAGNVKKLILKTERVTDENGNSDFPQHFTILLYSTETAAFGDTVTAQIELRTPYEYRGYDLSDYYASDGIFVTGTCYDGFIDAIHTDEHKIPKFLQSVRIFVRTRAELAFDGRDSAFVNALLLGDKSDISDEDIDTIRDAGASHLIVVSGMHTSILAFALFMLLRRLRIGYRISAAITSVFLLFYMALLGFAPSVTRAGIMTILLFIGQIILRSSDPLNSLGVAVTAMLFVRPYFCFDVGFLLSVSATFGILLFMNRYHEGIKNLSFSKVPKILSRVTYSFLSLLMVSFAASLFVLPVLLIFFDEFSTMSLLSSFLLVPVVTSALPIFVFTVFGANIPVIGVILKGASEILINIFYFVVKKIAALPFSTLPSGYRILSFAVVIALLGIVICMITGIIRKQTLLCIVCAVLVISGGVFGQILLNYEAVTTAIYSNEDGSSLAIRDGVGYIIIGCGNDTYAKEELASHIKKYSKNANLLLVLPSPQSVYAVKPEVLLNLLPAQTIAAFEPTDEEVETLITDHISLDCYGHGTYEIYLFENGFYVEILTDDQSAILIGGNPNAPQKYYDYCFILDGECEYYPDCVTLFTVADSPETGNIIPQDELMIVRTGPNGLFVGAENFWN
ncbi:MAG TPA: ComEC/Rec2 family competence protein [Oscillospiraceae bacterium]|nr:ComEC/Rec2 family competence protein [Oscillospiraceae bacterium]